MARSDHQDIHVLHVLPGLKPGGIEFALSRVIRQLSGSFRHSIICLKGEAELAGSFDSAVRIHCLRAKPQEPALFLRLAKLLREIRPDMIHARNWGAWPDAAIASKMIRPSVPLVWSFHGTDGSGSIPLRRRLACRLLAMVTARMFTVSQAARKMLITDIGLPHDRIDVISNGIDISSFSNERDGRHDDDTALRIGTVGNLTTVKNHSMLLHSAGLLRDRRIEFHLAIAGEGPQRESLLRQAQHLRIENHVELLGYVRDIPSFLRSLDIFVMSSRTEAHPNALLEAMAAGLPCGSSAGGGCGAVLDQGRCCILGPDGRAEAMAEALASLAGSAARRRDLGSAGRTRVQEQYSLAQMIEDYRKLYLSVANRTVVQKKASNVRHLRDS